MLFKWRATLNVSYRSDSTIQLRITVGDKPGHYEVPVYAACMEITGAADQEHVRRDISCQQALHTENKKLCSFGCCIQEPEPTTQLFSQHRKMEKEREKARGHGFLSLILALHIKFCRKRLMIKIYLISNLCSLELPVTMLRLWWQIC